MKALKIVGIVLALGVAVLLGLASRKPDTFAVSRSVSIDAPPEKIYPLIDTIADNAKWSPYFMRDPEMKTAYAGPASGPGAKVDFDGNAEVGSGSVTITETQPSTLVKMRLQMLKPMQADNQVEFRLAPQGTSTLVSWTMRGHCPFAAKIIHVIFDMDQMVGGDFALGLANLKKLVETQQGAMQ